MRLLVGTKVVHDFWKRVFVGFLQSFVKLHQTTHNFKGLEYRWMDGEN